ncbi:MAG: GNAT family N-acetyltransferase [Elioraea sp.]|nr:GNAT family N-acetyltransferase [Elioraea sp.]
MRHKLRSEGFWFALRSVCDDDAAFIVALRKNPRAWALHPGARSVDEQLAWLAAYYERPCNCDFVVQPMEDGQAEGLIGVWHCGMQDRGATWGRRVLREGSLAEPASVFLLFRTALETLECESVSSTPSPRRPRSFPFYDRYATAERRLEEHFLLGDGRFDAVEHKRRRHDWPRVAAVLADAALEGRTEPRAPFAAGHTSRRGTTGAGRRAAVSRQAGGPC